MISKMRLNMSRKSGFFILATAAMISLFSPNGAAVDTHPEMQNLPPVTISSIDAKIRDLELRKQAYDAEAHRLGSAAARLQFEDFLLARQLYSQEKQLQYKSEALQLKIEKLKKQKASMQKGHG